MTQHYIGTKQITAWRDDRPADQENDARPGYAVKYKDGHISWSPEEVFEQAYLPMGEGADGTRITPEMVEDFILPVEDTDWQRIANHLVLLTRCRNGFTIITESACVDPDNYDVEVGMRIAQEKAWAQVWAYLGFMLVSARNGV